MMTGETAPNRTLYTITGADRIGFLQGLITNDISKAKDGLCYAAILTPQGKYLADFFLTEREGSVLLDVDASIGQMVAQRLTMYKLRADVTIAPSDLHVTVGLGDVPAGAAADPRDPAMGWRMYGGAGTEATIDWDAIRVTHVIPHTGVELNGDTYILEAGFQRIDGVDFKKGCYVGQEITARMKHKTELKKGLVQVRIDGAAPVGTPITADGKPVGTLFTQSGDCALAHIRFDRATGPMTAGDATLWYNAH